MPTLRTLRRLVCIGSCVLSATPRSTTAAQALTERTVDSIVGRALKTFPTPGVAVVVIQDGKIVVAKGYGVKTLGDTTRVTPRTRFGIASNTKVFTATALGILVEERKIECERIQLALR